MWILLLAGATLSCSENKKIHPNPSLYGEPAAVEKVNQLMEMMGGAERWRSVEAIYIHARHYEQRLEKPYESKIWRNLVGPEIKIVQWNEDFRIERYISGDNGWTKRNDENPELLSSATLEWLKNWDEHLFYRTIHRLAEGDRLKLERRENKIYITENGDFYASIELGNDGYPYQYGTPTVEGDTSYTLYTKWAESNGFHHPVISTNADSTFRFEAVEWQAFGAVLPDSIFLNFAK